MKFTFGRTVGEHLADPFGEPTRRRFRSIRSVNCSWGRVCGVNFHDNDAIPIESTPEQAKQIVKDFKKSSKERPDSPDGDGQSFSDPVFKDGVHE